MTQPHCDICTSCKYYLMSTGYTAALKSAKKTGVAAALFAATSGALVTAVLFWVFRRHLCG